MTKALIVGGGVAGPVAAMALERAGIESTVFEAYPRGATDVGAFLSFAVNGVDALRAIGADASVRELGFPTSRMVFTSGSGKRLGEVEGGGKLSDGTVTHTIKRADLYRVLQDEAARRGADVRYGKRLVDAENRPDGTVVARFEDGTEDTGDLLIGCDGIHSRTRSIIDSTAPGPRYVPVLNVGGYAHVDDVAVDFDPDTYHMVFGKRAFFGYAVTPTGEIWWFANPPRLTEPSREQVAAITDAQWRAELRELYEKDASPAARIVAATPGELSGFTTYDMPPVPTWHSGAMIVIGDAAHATSPAAGQGASMAIEDAVVLAQCLRDAADVPTAFRIFESTRRERVERMVAHGHRSSNSKAAGPVGRVIRDLMLPRFLKKMSEGDESAAFMFDHHIDWDAAVAA